jgi:hypothetical protein
MKNADKRILMNRISNLDENSGKCNDQFEIALDILHLKNADINNIIDTDLLFGELYMECRRLNLPTKKTFYPKYYKEYTLNIYDHCRKIETFND